AAVVELLNSAEEPDIAFLNQVRERKTTVHVSPGDAHHQPQIGFDQPPPRSVSRVDFVEKRLDLLGAQAGTVILEVERSPDAGSPQLVVFAQCVAGEV